MEKFVHEQNLSLFRRVLSETTEASKRKALIELIRVELEKEQIRKEKG